jgi:hypothetical protein
MQVSSGVTSWLPRVFLPGFHRYFLQDLSGFTSWLPQVLLIGLLRYYILASSGIPYRPPQTFLRLASSGNNILTSSGLYYILTSSGINSWLPQVCIHYMLHPVFLTGFLSY